MASRILKIFFFFSCTFVFFAPAVPAQDTNINLGHHYEEHSKVPRDNPEPIVLEGKSTKKSSSVLSTVLLYIPNRIFDFLDIFRFRVRVGPGAGVGVRVTEPLSIYAGSHAAIYAGLPGPRQSPGVPLPVGAEAVAGGKLSLLNGVFAADTSSRHSFSEIGVETQLLLIGVDIGIDPVEILDFFTGFFLIQIREDDL
jgi:hypothetical protein